MADPEVTQGMFHPIAEPSETGWVLMVVLAGEGLESRAVPLVAEVGDQAVEGLAVDEGGATGFLSAVPPVGAPLRVGYLGRELRDTGITFPERPNA